MTTHNHDVLIAINSRIINGRSSDAKQLNADYRALVKARDEIIKLREKLAAPPVPVKTYHDGKPWPVAPKPWVELTDAEVMQTMSGDWTSQFYFARAIEAKLKEKHT